MVTNGRDLINSLELQFEQEPQEPPCLLEKRSQAFHAKKPAAIAAIEMARTSCM